MSTEPTFRLAEAADLETMIRLLADDPLGVNREDGAGPPGDAYVKAFEAIREQPGNELWVAVAPQHE